MANCQEHQTMPCLQCHPQGYIYMVQNLIERCMCFRMTMDDCIQALSKHAGIQPAVTFTVWRELLKENRSFFRAYNHVVSSPPTQPNFSNNSSDQRISGRTQGQWR